MDASPYVVDREGGSDVHAESAIHTPKGRGQAQPPYVLAEAVVGAPTREATEEGKPTGYARPL